MLYYFGARDAECERLLQRTTAGNVGINNTVMHLAQDDLPFVGVGPSGMGAYHRAGGIRAMSHAKGVISGRRSFARLLHAPFGKLANLALSAPLGKADGRLRTRFDLYTNPDIKTRKLAPYLLDVQGSHVGILPARTMVPLRPARRLPFSGKPIDPPPVFDVPTEECFLDTPGMSAVPLNALGKCIGSLSDRREAILAALDRIFGHTER
ncbi:hypothetical protein C0Z16_34110 [Paraburkholderia rhynchosiae]|uniref:Toxin CcdB n=1 Tax=Paraburkholderia rhynchosiae TaxID=487049 RepID=A0ABX4UUB6_9BURK|nr:CcdB family protein [Paraburkholderia rhynchosiae]PMS21081.1 hypothetical protein C0Z16_34110 [Paraburkholderia rhynchosiae]